MAVLGFCVTYSVVTPESAERGEFEAVGVVIESGTLRECLDAIGDYASDADCYPIGTKSPPRWFTNHEYRENFETGATESRSLHLPDSITNASRLRIARYLGLRTC